MHPQTPIAQTAKRTPPAWLRALGRADLPRDVRFGEGRFRHVQTLKHDFFAATGLYEGPSGRIIYKMGRTARLFGLPMSWLGRLSAQHEARMYQLLADVPGVPAFIGRLGPTGFAHACIEGRPLGKNDRVDDAFFPTLERLLAAVHAHDVAYVDLEKRENILIGDDGRPWLIDFQISWHVPANRGGRLPAARAVLRLLQQADLYHLAKHVRRQRPDLAAAQGSNVPGLPWWIGLHRRLFSPLTRLRRRVLVLLGARQTSHRSQPTSA